LTQAVMTAFAPRIGPLSVASAVPATTASAAAATASKRTSVGCMNSPLG
jgi:hypothetical protein